MDDNETPFINHGCVDHLPESDIERKREPYTESSYNNEILNNYYTARSQVINAALDGWGRDRRGFSLLSRALDIYIKWIPLPKNNNSSTVAASRESVAI